MIILIEKKEYFLKELDNKVILSWKIIWRLLMIFKLLKIYLLYYYIKIKPF